jgi:hypothetical protein
MVAIQTRQSWHNSPGKRHPAPVTIAELAKLIRAWQKPAFCAS